jgi:hypothetical protein
MLKVLTLFLLTISNIVYGSVKVIQPLNNQSYKNIEELTVKVNVSQFWSNSLVYNLLPTSNIGINFTCKAYLDFEQTDDFEKVVWSENVAHRDVKKSIIDLDFVLPVGSNLHYDLKVTCRKYFLIWYVESKHSITFDTYEK